MGKNKDLGLENKDSNSDSNTSYSLILCKLLNFTVSQFFFQIRNGDSKVIYHLGFL